MVSLHFNRSACRYSTPDLPGLEGSHIIWGLRPLRVATVRMEGALVDLSAKHGRSPCCRPRLTCGRSLLLGDLAKGLSCDRRRFNPTHACRRCITNACAAIEALVSRAPWRTTHQGTCEAASFASWRRSPSGRSAIREALTARMENSPGCRKRHTGLPDDLMLNCPHRIVQFTIYTQHPSRQLVSRGTMAPDTYRGTYLRCQRCHRQYRNDT